MGKLQPYGSEVMISVTDQMSASRITCITSGQQNDGAPDPGSVKDDHTERPEEVATKSDLTQLF
jgi:hypothetical protein